MKTFNIIKPLFIGMLCITPVVVGCMDEQLPPTEDSADIDDNSEIDTDVDTRAICLLPPLPAPFDHYVDFETLPSNGRLFLENDYGTAACSRHTTRFVGHGKWQVGVGVSKPTNVAACLGVKLTVTYDHHSGTGGWQRKTSILSGEWANQVGCVLPQFEESMQQSDDVRITARLETSACATCAVQYGRPFFIVAKPT